MYVFNRITVNPQLPKRIEKLGKISLMVGVEYGIFETISKNRYGFMGTMCKKPSEIS